MDTLNPFSGHEGPQELKKIAVRFEEKIYTAATSQSDYLRNVSLKMLTMETRSQNPMSDAMKSNSAANSVNPSDPGPLPSAGTSDGRSQFSTHPQHQFSQHPQYGHHQQPQHPYGAHFAYSFQPGILGVAPAHQHSYGPPTPHYDRPPSPSGYFHPAPSSFSHMGSRFLGQTVMPPQHGSQPTDLASVFSFMSLQHPAQDPQYYMDSGASSHMTYNSGS